MKKIAPESPNCSCYDNADTHQSPAMEIKTLKNLETGELLFSCNELLLILDGRLLFSRDRVLGEEYHKGQMVCLPAGDSLHYRSLTKSRLLILRIEHRVDLCYSFSFDRLCAVKSEADRPEGLFPLEMNTPLRHFIQSLVHTLDEGLKCKTYFRNGISVLLTMLHTYYSPAQLCRFFYSILTTDTLFSEQVRKHYVKCRTANDLATALEMTPKQLSRRFMSVFGRSPYEWMQQEKARLIHADISMSNKPFKEIAQKHGFSDQANFSRFCQMAFSMNPKDIRKQQRLAVSISQEQ